MKAGPLGIVKGYSKLYWVDVYSLAKICLHVKAASSEISFPDHYFCALTLSFPFSNAPVHQALANTLFSSLSDWLWTLWLIISFVALSIPSLVFLSEHQGQSISSSLIAVTLLGTFSQLCPRRRLYTDFIPSQYNHRQGAAIFFFTPPRISHSPHH